ncbi:MAG TPA: hypothetical protein VLD39_02045, partial [Gammaproteobacteria bacterium]|nr:hypothetical protein [Gammaproteobacteria bacterium]
MPEAKVQFVGESVHASHALAVAGIAEKLTGETLPLEPPRRVLREPEFAPRRSERSADEGAQAIGKQVVL